MMRWLKRIAFVLLVLVTALMCGNLEGAGVVLLLATFFGFFGSATSRRWKVVLLLIWGVAFVLAIAVSIVAFGPETASRRKVILRLYDLNCSAPFSTYRYPRDVLWLAAENPIHPHGDWKRVLACGAWMR
jgi:hypothetical protein